MKKYSILLLAAASLSLLAVSCAKELTQEQDVPTISAYVEAGDPATKASAVPAEEGGYKVVWDKGDSISVFNKVSLNQKYTLLGQGGTTHGKFMFAVGSFSLSYGTTLPYIYCIYPYNEYNSAFSKGLTTMIPTTQVYHKDGFDPKANVMVGASKTKESIPFKNVGSYLLIQLYGTNAKVKSITVTSAAGEYIAGPMSVNMVPGEEPVIDDPVYERPTELVRSSEKKVSYSIKGSKRVTLTCKDSVAVGATAAEATTFWLVLRPQELEEGFTVRVKWTGGTTTKKLTSKIDLARNTICRMEALDLVPDEVVEGDFVEMGPDGLQWATCNLGADTPEEAGDYFAWGETEPKDDYTWMTYKYHTHESNDYEYVTKYTFADDQTECIWYDSNNNFIGDNKVELEAGDDAATQILGSDYRIPTAAEWDWLLKNCTWEAVWSDDEEDLLGYEVTNDDTGNSIFLPAAGDFEDDDLDDYQEEGYYWSSSLPTPGSLQDYWGLYTYSDYACFVCFDSEDDYHGLCCGSRRYGYSIRPVKGAKTMLLR